MKKIKFNKNEIHFERIVAYGCSHTEAAETCDHTLLGVSQDECDALKRKTKPDDFYLNLIQKNNLSFEQLREKYKQNSYIKYLADIFETPWINNAQGGTSLQHSCFLLTKDLIQNKIKQNDLIIIGVTCPNRLFYFNENYDLENKKLINHFQLSNPSSIEYMIDTFANDITLCWSYFQSIKYLDMLNKETSNKIIFLPTSHSIQEWMSLKSPLFANFFSDSLSSMDVIPESFEPFVRHIFEDTASRKRAEEKELCGYGHVKTLAHKQYAERLYQYLTKDLS